MEDSRETVPLASEHRQAIDTVRSTAARPVS
jgi:hypothetical protein